MLRVCFATLARAILATILVSPLAVGSVPALGTTIFDVVDDFSTTTNSETSQWSYRYSTDLVRDGDYTLLPNFSDPQLGSLFSGSFWDNSQNYWNLSGPAVPAIGVNDTGGDILVNPQFPPITWTDQTIWMHPNFTGFTVVSWLSPSAGTVDIDFKFFDMDPNGGDGVGWFVDLGSDSGELDSGTFANGGATGLITLNLLSVAAGDRINFLVAPLSSASFDSTGLTATITLSETNVIPVPAALPLLLTGLAGLGLIGWRRRKAA